MNFVFSDKLLGDKLNMVIYSRAKKPHPFMNEGGFKAFYKDRNISPS